MPRLSIVIPHRNDDRRLEESILSVLENRPRDSEIIVVHDGSYLDPYKLSDEVVYVIEQPRSSVTQLLNAGLQASCSPVICALLDGVTVVSNWAEPALKRFARNDVAAISPLVQMGGVVVTGIAHEALRNVSSLRSGLVDSNQYGTIAAPTLAAGFYRRKVLLAVGGWCEAIGASVADIELALLFEELGLTCECESTSVVAADAKCIPGRKSKQASYELAGVASAHALAVSSLPTVIRTVLAGCVTSKLGAAISWLSGLKRNAVNEDVELRMEKAGKLFFGAQMTGSIKVCAETTSDGHEIAAQRRKAA